MEWSELVKNDLQIRNRVEGFFNDFNKLTNNDENESNDNDNENENDDPSESTDMVMIE